MSIFPVPGGGVTVMWSFTDPGDGHGAGAIRQYHLPQARAAVTAALQQARTNGQQRIAVCTEYFEGGTSFHLDSSDGLAVQDKENLKAFCEDAVRIGFSYLLLETGPAWSASPDNWMNPTVMQSVGDKCLPFNPLAYGRNFRIVMDQCDVVAAAGFGQWGVDSHTEAFHGGTMDPEYLEYLRRWWGDVVHQIGLTNNPGMSCADIGNSDLPSLVSNIKLVYGDKVPPLTLAHAYRNLPTQWPAFQAEMVKQGMGGRGYIVGESYCHDPISHAVLDADQNIFWRHTWPVSPDTPENGTQDQFAVEYVGP